MVQIYKLEVRMPRPKETYTLYDELEFRFVEWDDAISFARSVFESINGDQMDIRFSIEQVEGEETPNEEFDESW